MLTNKPLNNLYRWLKTWAKLKPLQFVKTLQQEFPAAKFYLVGGMVRDLALGRPSKDFDLVVTGVPAKPLEAALEKLGRVNLVGKNFGVFKFTPRGGDPSDPIDVALPRTEHAFGTGGYRDVEVQSDPKLPIENDLARRDFTINSMALKLNSEFRISNFEIDSKLKIQNSKFLVDPFGGLDDLVKKTIRCVGKPEERFHEDYSRMLRAIRFACQLDFEIEPATWKAVMQHIKHLNREINGNRIVPSEVIAKELVKAVVAYPVWALELLDDSGAVSTLMPELLKMKRCPQPPQFHSEGDVWTHTVLALTKLGSKEFHKEFKNQNSKKDKNLQPTTYNLQPELVWATLFHDLGKPYTLTVTDRIRTNGHDIKGAKVFAQIAERLKLASTGLNVAAIEWLIAKHLIATYAKRDQMKETTVEKYFFNDQVPGRQLLQLTFVDIAATVPPSGKPDFTAYRQLKNRVQSLQRRLAAKQRLPRALLDGNAIMKILKLPPSRHIGEIKEYLREQQLGGKIKTKAQAKKAVLNKFDTPDSRRYR